MDDKTFEELPIIDKTIFDKDEFLDEMNNKTSQFKSNKDGKTDE